MGSSEQDQSSKSTSSWRSVFKSPATAKYNKVLADSYEKKQAKTADDDADTIREMTDEQKAKAMVEHRDATSVTGTYILGEYRPAATCSGQEGYLSAKFMGGM